ncbi:MAG: quinoprotein dehydrogenase-associated putative ABC transporter substrate-binding protein [Anaeromyxobacteraceae bacterium]
MTAAALLLAAALAAGPPAPGARGAPLRVCLDPNNLPFSNARGEGLENRLAALLARELGRPLEPIWLAQRRGFFRQGLKEGACDAVMGVPVGLGRALLTRPYYTSSYVFAWRRGAGPEISSFDDPGLREVVVGVQLPGNDGAATPPGHALARRGLVANVRGFPLTADYREPDPPARILDALVRGEIAVAAVWGPLAGWYARRAPIAFRPVREASDGGLPMRYAIAVAVSPRDPSLRDALDAALERRRAEVERLLADAGVPRVEAP